MPRIFLSPSTQEYNAYINGGTEEEYMNLIADALEPYLRDLHIDYARNDPALTVGGSVRLSNAYGPDLHLALHSNAAPEYLSGLIQGTDIYYYTGSSQGERFANLLKETFEQIYPYPELVGAIPTTNLYELRETQAPAVLIEIAYHDNPEDAFWIKENVNEIAQALAAAAAAYFNLPFLYPPAGPESFGRISTPGFSVNLRTEPDWSAPSLAILENGTAVNLLSFNQGWYLVQTDGLTGYVSSQYLS